jgi:general secretion pathway protein J
MSIFPARKTNRGFTLLEILVALFIFAILAALMASALRTIINAVSGVERQAGQLRQLQFALLVLSRDIEQTVNRSIRNTGGQEELALIGTHDTLSFTHMGSANDAAGAAKSSMQRVQYVFGNGSLSRFVWPVLDQAPSTVSQGRLLLNKLGEGRFEYLSEDNKFYSSWPLTSQPSLSLPLAIRVFISIPSWGKISQLYVIPTQPISKK